MVLIIRRREEVNDLFVLDRSALVDDPLKSMSEEFVNLHHQDGIPVILEPTTQPGVQIETSTRYLESLKVLFDSLYECFEQDENSNNQVLRYPILGFSEETVQLALEYIDLCFTLMRKREVSSSDTVILVDHLQIVDEDGTRTFCSPAEYSWVSRMSDDQLTKLLKFSQYYDFEALTGLLSTFLAAQIIESRKKSTSSSRPATRFGFVRDFSSLKQREVLRFYS